MKPAALAAAALLLAAPAHAADPAAGEKVFKSQCGNCHAATAGRNGIGPSLHGVVGRPAGSVPGYAYSAANKDAGLTWDAGTLDPYLADPRAAMPGTRMAYNGLKNDTQRADLIAYLDTLH